MISLASGAVGGNVAGSLLKNFSLGTLWNSVVGILGGGIGSWVLSLLGMAVDTSAGMDIGSILSTIAASGVGGGVLLPIIGVIKNMMSKS